MATKTVDTDLSFAGAGRIRDLAAPLLPNDAARLTDIAGTNSGVNTGDQTSIVGITGTKAQFDTAVTDGNIQYVGDAPTAHTHLLAAGATDVTITAANLNALDDNANTALHFHNADRARADHTGTQLASTVSDFSAAADARIGAASINALADVIITAPSVTQVLKYNGTNWINDTDATGGGGGSSLLTENIQSGTTYTFLATDVDKMVTATGASPVFTLPLNAVTPITVYSQGTFRHKGTGVARFQITGAGIIDGKTAGFVSVLPGQELQYWKTATDTWETVISAPNPYAIAAVFAAGTFNL